ncbi:MAG: CoB--CoM heterodisulfide reductase iron-sulfur subunit A family protein [Candidatus Lokiarchaeota archaeon]|nr:CoB--CoM heterodisulfide reductase iron-sulfur subunit A family protein [Candidatus Lokiarchaeota archaeon]
MSYDVAIIGAGIGGIHCAIELKKIGLNPILIEKEPYIGGMAVKIGKCFPNQDCASCISDDGYITKTQGIRKCLYKMKLDDDFKFEYFTSSKIIKINKIENKYAIKLFIKPKFINNDCNNCGLCINACPNSIDDSFNFNWTKKKAIFLPFQNCVPNKLVIDRLNCIDCNEECAKVCPKNAIDLKAKEQILEIKVKYLVISSGFQEFDAKRINEYGFSLHKNVITQLQVARMLDSTNSTKGQILKPSDWKKPKNALIILCVGSRDFRYNEYCSGICCSYSLKHAIELRNQDIDVTISYIDLRLQEDAFFYLKEAREKKINFINRKVARIEEDHETKKLYVAIEQSDNNKELVFDLVILTPALVPSNNIEFLVNLGIKSDKYGFIHVDEWGFQGTNSQIENIFSIGCIDGPKNIPQTILQARAIAFSILSKERDN